MTVLEHTLQAVASIVFIFGVITVALTLVLTGPGLMLVFVAALILLTASGSAVTLLAIDYLYPEAVVVSGLVGLLWLVVPASCVSVLVFDLVLEGVILKALKRAGLNLSLIWIVEAFAGGVFLSLSLAANARLSPDTELPAGAALTAGLITAFVRYYLGLWFGEMNPGEEAEVFDEDID